jgi:hypothetical protein
MGLFSILEKGIKAMIDEANTPESFKKGQKFEEYVREYLFIASHFDILERTHNYKENCKDYVESSLKPDFKFRDKKTKQEFYLEAKFRSSTYNGKLVWCNDKQLARYKRYDKETPVFIIIGFGEDPKLPECLTLLSLKLAKYTGLFLSVADKYAIDVDKPVTSKTLWSS